MKERTKNLFGKGLQMLKAIVTHLRAAVVLIAAEDLKALRILAKNIRESFTKSFQVHRKT